MMEPAHTQQIHTATDGTTATNDYPGRLVFSTTGAGGSSPSERLRITSAGLVGIGTGSPTSTLHIQHAAQTAGYWEGKGLLIHEDATANQGIALYSRGGTEQYIASLADDANSYLIIGTRKSSSVNEVDAITIRGDGKVGIGTTSPAHLLDVAATTPIVRINATGGGTPSLSIFSNGVYEWLLQGGTALKFVQDATERARIDSSGRLLVGTSSSTGLLSNTAPVIAGLFKSFDDAATFTTGVAQTLFTVPNTDATYIITLRRGAVGDALNYQAVSILSANATVGGSVTTVLTALKTAGNVSISISGTNLQGTQTSGGAASLQWVVTRVG
jgi:hypothetical protein